MMKDTRERCYDLFSQGVSAKQAALRLGISERQAEFYQSDYKRDQADGRGRQFTRKEIYEMFERGMTPDQVWSRSSYARPAVYEAYYEWQSMQNLKTKKPKKKKKPEGPPPRTTASGMRFY